jgi:hypothetical protein
MGISTRERTRVRVYESGKILTSQIVYGCSLLDIHRVQPLDKLRVVIFFDVTSRDSIPGYSELYPSIRRG